MAQKLSRLNTIGIFSFYHGADCSVVVAFLVFAPNVAADTTGTLSPPLSPLFDPPKAKVSPFMAIVLICFICVFFLLGCISIYIRQCLERRLARRLAFGASDQYQMGSNTTAGAPLWETARRLGAAVIDAFPKFLYSEVQGMKIGKAAQECAVCLNEFKDDETLRFLPRCSHVFHQHCIDAWLASQVTCLVCRANLAPRPGDPPIYATMLSRDESDGEQVVDSDRPSPQTHPPLHPRSVQTVEADPKDSIIMVVTQSPDVQNPNQRSIEAPIRTRTSTKDQNNRKFHRFHSTGHSMVQQEPYRDFDRFTLRLPEEVRALLLNTRLSRTKSCVALLRSYIKGYRSRSGGRNSD